MESTARQEPEISHVPIRTGETLQDILPAWTSTSQVVEDPYRISTALKDQSNSRSRLKTLKQKLHRPRTLCFSYRRFALCELDTPRDRSPAIPQKTPYVAVEHCLRLRSLAARREVPVASPASQIARLAIRPRFPKRHGREANCIQVISEFRTSFLTLCRFPSPSPSGRLKWSSASASLEASTSPSAIATPIEKNTR